MLMPSIFGENFFDDFFDPMFHEMDRMDKKLYGKNAARVMKTDVRENEKDFEVIIDLPGFKKDQVKLELDNGYLTISAEKGMEKENKDQAHGRLIRSERYTGAMQRSFYVGDNLTEEDIKAKFEDGVLTVTVPKEEPRKLPEKKTIMIEG